jgi:hypothetical protein
MKNVIEVVVLSLQTLTGLVVKCNVVTVLTMVVGDLTLT